MGGIVTRYDNPVMGTFTFSKTSRASGKPQKRFPVVSLSASVVASESGLEQARTWRWLVLGNVKLVVPDTHISFAPVRWT